VEYGKAHCRVQEQGYEGGQTGDGSRRSEVGGRRSEDEAPSTEDKGQRTEDVS
jgi:hypothetical protein